MLNNDIPSFRRFLSIDKEVNAIYYSIEYLNKGDADGFDHRQRLTASSDSFRSPFGDIEEEGNILVL